MVSYSHCTHEVSCKSNALVACCVFGCCVGADTFCIFRGRVPLRLSRRCCSAVEVHVEVQVLVLVSVLQCIQKAGPLGLPLLLLI